MLLYVCEQCGAWQDVSLADAWNKAFQPLGRALALGLAQAYNLKVEEQPIEEPAGWPCPLNAEHGSMRAIGSEDRLFVKAAIVEAEQFREQIHAVTTLPGVSSDQIACYDAQLKQLAADAGRESEEAENEKRRQLIEEIDRLAGRQLGLVGMHDLQLASIDRVEGLLATIKRERGLL